MEAFIAHGFSPLSSKRPFRVDRLSEMLDARFVGDGAIELTGMSSLADAGPTDVSFFADTRYRDALNQTQAGAIIIKEPVDSIDVPQIVHDDPFLAFVQLADAFFPDPNREAASGVHPLAHVSDTASVAPDATVSAFAFIGERASVGPRVVIHPGVIIGNDVSIGEDTLLWPRVVIRDRCTVGARVIIHPGAVIGADGFGFARREGRFIKVRHVGSVEISDDVEIGANATVDRGTLGNTVIHRGVKIDNLVHVAHNVQIGEHSALAAQTGISGSTVVGKRVLMGGQTGVVDHLHIGDDAVMIAQSGVIGNVDEKTLVSGYPARPHREVLKSVAELRSISKLRDKIRQLEQRLDQLEPKDDD